MDATADDAPSSPSDGAPPGSWTLAVVMGALLALVGSVVAELSWRSLGHTPTVDAEDLDLWSAERRRASNGRAEVIALIGKSRMQLDVDGATLRRRYPDHTIVQLALRGRSAWATFEDLALDEDFRGKIVFDFQEADLAMDASELQLPAVERAREIGPDAVWNARLRAWLSSHVVVRSPLLPPSRLVEGLARSAWPIRNFIVVDPDRFSRADFSRADINVVSDLVLARERAARERMGDMETPAYPLLDEVKRASMYVSALRARGGDVVFVKLPVSGEGAAHAERFFPKARFYDALPAIVPALFVHFADVPSLRGFTCPDTSHLDGKDTARFTGALFRELEKRGFLAPGSGSF